jgi:hypothetical protein
MKTRGPRRSRLRTALGLDTLAMTYRMIANPVAPVKPPYFQQKTILLFMQNEMSISYWCSFKRNRAQATHRSSFHHAVELGIAADRQVLQRSSKGASGSLVVSLSILVYIASFCILQV